MTTLSNSQRLATTQHLRDIWDKRDVPAIPDQELKRLTDRDLVYLLHFWSFKDQTWDNPNPPPFRVEPPQGWERMFAPVVNGHGDIVAEGTPPEADKPKSKFPPPVAECDCHFTNFGHQFKQTGGGYLTPRQAFKLRGEAF